MCWNSIQRALIAFIVFLFASALFGIAGDTAMLSSRHVPGRDAVSRTSAKLSDVPPLADTPRAYDPYKKLPSLLRS